MLTSYYITFYNEENTFFNIDNFSYAFFLYKG